MNAKDQIEKLLALAGIKINGLNDYDLRVFNEKLYSRVLAGGSMALGESYMDGWWDAKALDQFFYKVIIARLDKKFKVNRKEFLMLLKNKFINLQSLLNSTKVVKQHYDLGVMLFKSFLDPYNQYTCGYFKDTNDLNKAQEQKLDLICKKLGVQSKDKVLDIGCGWGGFAKFASEHYKCHVTGITISNEQAEYARQYTNGLPVNILKCDYRELGEEKFDKILICGMIEHVGYKNYRTIMEILHKRLKNNGLFLLHTMGLSESSILTDPWIEKYIFPNSMIPSMVQISKSIEGLFMVEDWHNFGAYYDKTLMAWFENFNKNWLKFKTLRDASGQAKYSEHFYRRGKYYLLFFAANFRARNFQLWQIVLSKNGVAGGYKSIR